MTDDNDFELDRLGSVSDCCGRCDCRVASHFDCDAGECEIRERYEELQSAAVELQLEARRAEIQIIKVASFSAIGLAVLLAPALVYGHFWGFMHDKAFTATWEMWAIALGPTGALTAIIAVMKARQHLPKRISKR